MRIGIDIDNTITDTVTLLKEYCRKYNEEVVKRDLQMNEKGYITSNLYEWTKEEEQGFFETYLDELRQNVELKPYAKEVINQLKQEHEIYIVTARNRRTRKNPKDESVEYLDKKGILYDELVAECEDKLAYCLEHKIDVMIDDAPDIIQTVAKKLPVIALKGIMNEDCKEENLIKVEEWNEVYEVIKKMEEKR